MPGIGPVTIFSLLADLPELGSWVSRRTTGTGIQRLAQVPILRAACAGWQSEPSSFAFSVNHMEPTNHLTRRLTKGFTLILSFSPQGRRDLSAFAGTTAVNNVAVSGAMA